LGDNKEKEQKDISRPRSIYRPENMGRLEAADGYAVIKGICGDTMEIYLKIDAGVASKAFFNTDGCQSSRACGSAAASLAQGKTIMEILRLSPADVLDKWGSLPQGNLHCAILSINTLHQAVADYLIKKNLG
jgi:nitrogen fixation NifU-like protein